MNKQKPVITEENYAPVLKTGDLFTAKSKRGELKTYEFVGFAPFDGTGCNYLVMRDTETGDYNGVEVTWFREQVCGRKIVLLDKKVTQGG